MLRKFKLVFFSLTMITLQACTVNKLGAENKTKSVQAQPEAKEQEKKNTTQSSKKEEIEIAIGDDIKKTLEQISITDHKKKEKNLKSILGSEYSLITIVKPGCVFCESMLAVAGASKLKTKSKFIIVMDEAHSDFEEFLGKREKFQKSLNATWVYDHENAFHNKLGVASFPRFFVVKDGVVEQYQKGLVLPKDQEKLAGKPFPEILQKLSEETIRWMQTL